MQRFVTALETPYLKSNKPRPINAQRFPVIKRRTRVLK